MVEIKIFQNSSHSESHDPGEVLFREGDGAVDAMFAVVEGEVELSLHGKCIETVGPGGILGEMALIDSGPRSATATALTAVRVVPVDADQFKYLVQDHPTFALQVMKVMVERLRKTNNAI